MICYDNETDSGLGLYDDDEVVYCYVELTVAFCTYMHVFVVAVVEMIVFSAQT